MQIRLAANLSFDSIVDGPGLRIVIWTQGCPHNCFKCHNPQTHDFASGFLKDCDEIVDQIVDYKLKSGVTFSGGEPFCQVEAILYLAKKLKDHNINIWSFSGFTYEEICTDEAKKAVLDYIDVLVDGKYVDSLKSDELIFKGSSNQRIIDVKESLKQGEVVLFNL